MYVLLALCKIGFFGMVALKDLSTEACPGFVLGGREISSAPWSEQTKGGGGKKRKKKIKK